MSIFGVQENFQPNRMKGLEVINIWKPQNLISRKISSLDDFIQAISTYKAPPLPVGD